MVSLNGLLSRKLEQREHHLIYAQGNASATSPGRDKTGGWRTSDKYNFGDVDQFTNVYTLRHRFCCVLVA